MIISRIENATRVLGQGQGYIGLPVRDDVVPLVVGFDQKVNDTVNGPGTPAMETAWEPTPDEIARIVKGAFVHLRILGTSHPPVMLEVGPVPYDDFAAG